MAINNRLLRIGCMRNFDVKRSIVDYHNLNFSVALLKHDQISSKRCRWSEAHLNTIDFKHPYLGIIPKQVSLVVSKLRQQLKCRMIMSSLRIAHPEVYNELIFKVSSLYGFLVQSISSSPHNSALENITNNMMTLEGS